VLPEGGRIADVDLAPLLRRLNEAATFAMQTDEIRRDESARALWHEVYPELSEGRPGLLGAITARAEAQVMRLSALYALLDRSALVTREHLMAALALWDYSERSAAFIFGEALGDPTADEILRSLRQTPEGLTRTSIRDLFGRNRSGGELGRAIAVLAEHGLIVRAESEHYEAGRPAEIWKATATTKTTKTTKHPTGGVFGRFGRLCRNPGGEHGDDDRATF
jgi:DNA-binding transcriptional ArsR family regulator